MKNDQGERAITKIAEIIEQHTMPGFLNVYSPRQAAKEIIQTFPSLLETNIHKQSEMT